MKHVEQCGFHEALDVFTANYDGDAQKRGRFGRQLHFGFLNTRAKRLRKCGGAPFFRQKSGGRHFLCKAQRAKQAA